VPWEIYVIRSQGKNLNQNWDSNIEVLTGKRVGKRPLRRRRRILENDIKIYPKVKVRAIGLIHTGIRIIGGFLV
jgi:hypothetical protein